MYNVGCGLFGIYAGILKKSGDEWKSKSDVTDEAITAVCNYMLMKKEIDNDFYGYTYNLKDGRKATLCIIVEKPENE